MQGLKRIIGALYWRAKYLLLVLVTCPRRFIFFFSSFGTKKSGRPTLYQPGLIRGKGKLSFGKNVRFGYAQSPAFYTTYAYIEARGPHAKVEFHNNIWCNNNFTVIADNTTITISDDCYIGANVEIVDSNFHDLTPQNRWHTDPYPKPVFIGKNVYLGNNVKIQKGVTIGDNSVIGNGSVVRHSIPANVIAAGNPCQILRNISEN